MKNTPKVGLVSNFWGAVHCAMLFAFCFLLFNATHFHRKTPPPLGRHEFHDPESQGKTKDQPNVLADDRRWVAVALKGYG